MNKIIKRAIFLLSLTEVSLATAQQSNAPSPYLEPDKPFLSIENPNRQAEAWAMCVATYEILSEFFSQSEPARSEQLKELANGAEVAIIMSQVINDLNKDMTPERFGGVWTMAKLSSTELPKTRRTMLEAEAESLKPDEGDIFIQNLIATFEVCVKNTEAQQFYIDTWRELAKRGLLKLPED